MNFPQSAEGLTKYIRSKDITPEQIYDVASKFDDLKFYFPNKEIFVLELIQDRWNDLKKLDFKKSYKIWQLFNEMWNSISDEVILKKLLKNLKVVPLLEQVLAFPDIETLLILPHIFETCKLINSTSTVDVSFEHACKILAGVLRLTLKHSSIEFEDEKRDALILEIITFVGFDNISEINHKLSITYCNQLLFATLEYLSQQKTENQQFLMSTEKLSSYIGKLLFSREINPVLLLDTFFKKNKTAIEPDTAIILFEESNKYLSKENFKQLESIFELIIGSQASVTVTLLNELSSSKKTLSHKFLEKLFNQTFENATTSNIYDSNFWSLVGHVLDLDLEIGIQNAERLMTLISRHRQDKLNKEDALLIWRKFVDCYVNAREYPKFLSMWQDYCKENSEDNLSDMLLDVDITKYISANITALSTNQQKKSISELIDLVVSDSDNQLNLLIFEIYLKGVQTLSYTVLPELKSTLARTFEIEGANLSDLWKIKYLIMQIYDDIMPLEQINFLSESSVSKFVSNDEEYPIEFYFFFFKLRELKDFDFSPFTNKFMKYFETLSESKSKEVLEELFTSWSSLINTLFKRDDISKLIKHLTEIENINLLDTIFENDDFFEERNIVYALVDNLSKQYSSEVITKYLTRIPLQCINKNVRIELINNISQNDTFTVNDFNLLDHLLTNPTYNTKLESDFNILLKVVSQMIKSLSVEYYTQTNFIFEKIFQNHLSQAKESVSEKFIKNTTSSVLEGINSNKFNIAYYYMASSMIKLLKTNETTSLKSIYINKVIDTLRRLTVKHDDKTLSWLIFSLYTIFSSREYTDKNVSDIRGIINKLITESESKSPELLSNIFLLNTTVFDDKLEFLYAQYIVVRENGGSSDILLPAVENVIDEHLNNDVVKFNDGLISTISSICENSSIEIYSSLLELATVQLEKITKENVIGSHLFVKFISELYTNIDKFKDNKDAILSFITSLHSLQVGKPWLFSQYCIELLFPFCVTLNMTFMKQNETNDDVFISTSKIISNILLISRIKLSSRNHLINLLLCEYLEICCNSKRYGVTSDSAKSLSRLIVNFCEPSNLSNIGNKHKGSLTSKTSFIRQSVRKYISILLIKFLHLSISSPFEASIRKELIPGIYAVLDLLSQNELNMINKILDNAGRQYFKLFYSDYRRLGKWHED